MPLYEYECKSCHDVVELLVRNQPDSSAAAAESCPRCGKAELARVLSVPAAPASGSSRQLPMAGGGGEECGMPRCCGGGCQI